MEKRIKELRKALNLNQTDFATQLGLTMRAIQKWEAGEVEIKISSILKIQKVFNVNLEWLVNGVGSMFNNIDTNITFNGELLELIIEAVEELFKDKQLYLTPLKKAKLVRILYEYLEKQIIEDRNNGKIITLNEYFNKNSASSIINIVSNL